MTRDELKKIIINNYLSGKQIVIVNIGTEKINGDSFGPLLGSMLENQVNILKVYGTLDDTINGKNLAIKMEYINAKHKNDLIIATDACFSKSDMKCEEDFIIEDGPFKPGAGINKTDLPEVGNASIKFCLKNSCIDEFDTLKVQTIKNVYNKTRKAAEYLFEIDTELSNINNNRQEIK